MRWRERRSFSVFVVFAVICCGSLLQFAGRWEMEAFGKKKLLPSQEEPAKKRCGLENDLERELRSSRTTTAQERVTDANITSGLEGQERSTRTRVGHSTSAIGVEPIGRRIGDVARKGGIGKIGVIENVEEIHVELEIHTLGQSRSLEDTKIELFECRPTQAIAP